MGSCCGKKKTAEKEEEEVLQLRANSTSSVKRKSSESIHEESLPVDEYEFVSSKDTWEIADPKKSIDEQVRLSLEKKLQIENPRKASDSGVSNVILFDKDTGSEIYKQVQINPNIILSASKSSPEMKSKWGDGTKVASISRSTSKERKSNASMTTQFYKTKVGTVEKIAVVFETDQSVEHEEVQKALSDFMENVTTEIPTIFDKIPKTSTSLAFGCDPGRPLKILAKIPRREIVKRPVKQIDFDERFNQLFGKFFIPGPGHITLPKCANIDDLPELVDTKPGWVTDNDVYYFVILIERVEGEKYLARLRSNPATSQLNDETQGEFFLCLFGGIEMLGLRLFHSGNQIWKIDRAQRILLMDKMKDIKPAAVHTDRDMKEDPFDIVNCCERLNLDEEKTREYLLISTY